MQAPVQRSADVIQAANNAAHHPENLRRQFAERLRREAAHNEKHVRHSNKPEEETIKRDGRGNSKRGSNGDNRDKEKKKAALDAFAGGGILDVRV
jgi:hypothetical protein